MDSGPSGRGFTLMRCSLAKAISGNLLSVCEPIGRPQFTYDALISTSALQALDQYLPNKTIFIRLLSSIPRSSEVLENFTDKWLPLLLR
jgi:hypothetical protein